MRPRLAGLQFSAVFSSPMQRARRTAEIAGYPHPKETPLLREVDYGRYEGKTSAAITDSRPGWELFRDGCPGGESPDEVYSRALQFIGLATSTPGPVLVFAHGHILRAVAVAWMGFDIIAAARFQLDVATISILVDDQHGRELKLWNSPAMAGSSAPSEAPAPAPNPR